MKIELSAEQQEKLAEIGRLIDEAYAHYYKFSDGYGKSSEGHVSLSFGNYFDRSGDDDEQSAIEPKVQVYSYVFGPHREHYFDNIDQALDVVKDWHAEEMGTVYDGHGDVITNGPSQGLYRQIEEKREAEMADFFAKMDAMRGDADDEDQADPKQV